MTFHAIIPAGGAGTRLWPLSRAGAPKFLSDLTGEGQSLLQQTVRRLEPLTGDNVTIVTGAKHVDAVRGQLPQFNEDHFLAEPSPRDSMAAIGLAVEVIYHRHGDVVVGSFAADHLIEDEESFRSAVAEAIEAAERGYVVTIGITPDSPSTGFGYIKAGESIEGLTVARTVEEFLEKPDVATAQSYVESGRYVWNAGMFIAKASVLLEALERFEPELFEGLVNLADVWDSEHRGVALGQFWPDLKKIAIDHAIAEPLAAEGGMAVVPANMGWSDVGDYASLRDVLTHDADYHGDAITGVSPRGAEHKVVAIDSPGAMVYTHSKPVTVLGIEDAIVVETEEAILVTTREHAQSVKKIVDGLHDVDLDELR